MQQLVAGLAMGKIKCGRPNAYRMIHADADSDCKAEDSKRQSMVSIMYVNKTLFCVAVPLLQQLLYLVGCGVVST